MRVLATGRTMLVAALLAVAAGIAAVSAQEATPGPIGVDPAGRVPLFVQAGTCDDPGETVFTLREAGYGRSVTSEATPVADEAVFVGSDLANVAAVGVTTVSATIDQLTAGPHAIEARVGAATAAQRVACGEIGGYRSGDDLVFGLGERGGSAYVGTAWIHDNGDGTATITVVLASGLARTGGADAAAGTSGRAGTGADGGDVLVPDVVEASGLVIEDGAFTVDELVLTAGVPTILHVVNSDERDYRFRIAELVAPVVIPAGGLASVEFTTPEPMTVTAELLPIDGDGPIDELTLIVEEPTELIS